LPYPLGFPHRLPSFGSLSIAVCVVPFTFLFSFSCYIKILFNCLIPSYYCCRGFLLSPNLLATRLVCPHLRLFIFPPSLVFENKLKKAPTSPIPSTF
ncbi:hypothetical protein M747DRAFT_251523, partial [Aspergillus niger ATCC 13496]